MTPRTESVPEDRHDLKKVPAATPSRRLPGSVFASTQEFVIVLSFDGAVVGMNRPTLTFTGWRREEVIGRALWSLEAMCAPNDELREAVGRAAAGQEVSLRQRWLNREERERSIDLVLTPVTGEAGSGGSLVVVGRDVTEAASALRELVDEREKYSGIVNISADAIISVDDTYQITDFNQGAEQVFGYSADEVRGRSLDILIPRRVRAAHLEHVRAFGRSKIEAKRMGERSEIAAVRKSGEEFPADASISKQVVGGTRYYTVVLRDITAQKRAEWSQRFLARAGSMLASSLDVATTLNSVAQLAADSVVADCCVIFDAMEAGVVRRVAVASADARRSAVLEQSRGESLAAGSSHPAVRVVATGRPILTEDTTELLSAQSEDDPDLALMRQLGVRSAIVVPMMARGRTGGAIGLYRVADQAFDGDDVALALDLAVRSALAVDNARLYESARRAIRARDEILAVVSHDLGNPVAAVRIGTTVLARAIVGLELPPAVIEHLGGIRKSVDQMDRLIRDLMDVERIESGRFAIGPTAVRPEAVVSSVIEMFNALASARPVALRSRVPANLPPLRADRERLVQALSNLVGNAIKFTQPGGTIEIVVEPAGDAVLVSVCDDGPGIDESHIEHIFDRFWQAAARREHGPGGGLGLGLAIVKGIIEAHGGRIWAESQPGEGTQIRFTLPYGGPVGSRTDDESRVRTSPTPEGDIA